VLGPGLVTGAADDDPSGIATYSQAGAAFGYSQLWTLTLCLPLMISVQEATARIGAVTGKGLAAVTRDVFPRRILYAVVSLVVMANVLNIGADIAAVGAALNLLIPLPDELLSTLFTIVLLSLVVFIPYHVYVRVLKLLALSLLAYVATALIVAEPWGVILGSTVVPHIQWTSAYVIVGILGTTISPYMFFWQASEEVEERRLADQHDRKRRAMRDIRTDNTNGMIVSQIGSWFMMVTTASVLHRNGILTIGTAADAAKALQPLVHTFPYAGTFAKAIFALGVVGMGLLGIPVLAGSASFAVSEVFGWSEGLESRPRDARAFYTVITVATLIGLLLTLAGIDPIRALIFAAVVNGVVAVPLVFLIRRIATDPSIMGSHVSGTLSRRMLMLTFTVMLVCALVMFVSLIAG
jgi:NRAMP (natural resistance-associated macrophage protein)-like metal ion transporter